MKKVENWELDIEEKSEDDYKIHEDAINPKHFPKQRHLDGRVDITDKMKDQAKVHLTNE